MKNTWIKTLSALAIAAAIPFAAHADSDHDRARNAVQAGQVLARMDGESSPGGNAVVRCD